MRAYFERHAFGNTTLADLLAELERASGRDLHDWAAAWLRTSGVSTLRPVRRRDGAACGRSPTTCAPHRIGVGAVRPAGDGCVLRERLDVEVAGEQRRRCAAEPLPDLLLLNDGDLTFAKVRFDDRSLATVLADLRTPRRPAGPGAVLGARCGTPARDAELPAAAFVGAVLRRRRRRERPGRGRDAARPGPHGGRPLRRATASRCCDALAEA